MLKNQRYKHCPPFFWVGNPPFKNDWISPCNGIINQVLERFFKVITLIYTLYVLLKNQRYKHRLSQEVEINVFYNTNLVTNKRLNSSYLQCFFTQYIDWLKWSGCGHNVLKYCFFLS